MYDRLIIQTSQDVAKPTHLKGWLRKTVQFSSSTFASTMPYKKEPRKGSENVPMLSAGPSMHLHMKKCECVHTCMYIDMYNQLAVTETLAN